MNASAAKSPAPLVSVVISCKNGAHWLPNCIGTLRRQTIVDRMEIIVVDNCSTDGTSDVARRELTGMAASKVIRNERDLAYTGGNNTGAAAATGDYVFILNDDTKSEPACLEELLRAIEATGAVAAVPALVELDSMKPVFSAPAGFDIFGRPSWAEYDHLDPQPHDCFMVGGAGFLIRRTVWQQLRGFDEKHFMYAEDDDISWKLWLAGHRSVYVNAAILHHRSGRDWEIKEFTRYLVNRNSLLVVAKNAQHILWLTFVSQMFMVLAEGFLMWLVSRSWSFARNSYFKAVTDCFGMWPHVREMRGFTRSIRQRSDWWMMRKFLRVRINRWDMVEAFFKRGERPVVKPAK